MPALPPFHCNPHTSRALLGPIAAAVRELEACTGHYLARIRLTSDDDRAALEAAQRALATAVAELDRLTGSSRPG
jgi:hypothetical protein